MFDLEYKPENGGFIPRSVAMANREKELEQKSKDIPSFKVEEVEELPEEVDIGTIYHKKEPGSDGSADYIYDGTGWIRLGD